MKIKSVAARVKAAGEQDGLKAGEFEAIVAVFGNVDSYGDIIVPGAFADEVAARKATGADPLPVIWSHQWNDPDSHIGTVLDLAEVEAEGDMPAGLWVKASLDVDDNPRAGRVSKLLNGRRVTQFSFAYDEITSGWGAYEGNEGWLLQKLKVWEVGPTLVGANQETTLLGAKRAIIDLAADLSRRGKAARRAGEVAATLAEIKTALAALDLDEVDDDQVATPDSKQTDQGVTGQGADGSADGAEEPTTTPAAPMLSQLAALELAAFDDDI